VDYYFVVCVDLCLEQRDTEDVDELVVVFKCIFIKIGLCRYSENVMFFLTFWSRNFTFKF